MARIRRRTLFDSHRHSLPWEKKHPTLPRTVVVLVLCGVMVTGCLPGEYQRFSALIDLKCNVEDSRVQITNYELVKAVDTIALVEVQRVDLVPPEERVGRGLLDSRIELEIETVFKGSIEPGHLQLFGVKDVTSRRREDDFGSSTSGMNHFAFPGYPCGAPISYWGHRHYLLFLVHSAGNDAWRFPNIPLSRVNEEVDGEDSPWGQAVKHYIRIANLNDEQAEAQALLDLQVEARRRDDPMLYPPALIDDVERYMKARKKP